MTAVAIHPHHGKESGEKFLAKHKQQCPKRPKFTEAWYVKGKTLFVLWPIIGTKRFRYIPYCEV